MRNKAAELAFLVSIIFRRALKRGAPFACATDENEQSDACVRGNAALPLRPGADGAEHVGAAHARRILLCG